MSRIRQKTCPRDKQQKSGNENFFLNKGIYTIITLSKTSNLLKGVGEGRVANTSVTSD